MNESYLLQLHHPNCFAGWNFTVYTSINQRTSYEKKKLIQARKKYSIPIYKVIKVDNTGTRYNSIIWREAIQIPRCSAIQTWHVLKKNIIFFESGTRSSL